MKINRRRDGSARHMLRSRANRAPRPRVRTVCGSIRAEAARTRRLLLRHHPGGSGQIRLQAGQADSALGVEAVSGGNTIQTVPSGGVQVSLRAC
jgi:hypothetical protein